MLAKENTSWQEMYMRTILEVDGQKMARLLSVRAKQSRGDCEIWRTTAIIMRNGTTWTMH